MFLVDNTHLMIFSQAKRSQQQKNDGGRTSIIGCKIGNKWRSGGCNSTNSLVVTILKKLDWIFVR